MTDKEKIKRTGAALDALAKICEAAPDLPVRCITPVLKEIQRWIK